MTSRVLIVRDPSDPVAQTSQVAWAVSHLRETLSRKGIVSAEKSAAGGVVAENGDSIIVVASPTATVARNALNRAGVSLPAAAESLAVMPGVIDGRSAILACGNDARGLVYAVLELADRASNHADPLAALFNSPPVVEQPASPIRGIARLFASDVEDKPWYYDQTFWNQYLTMLATQRFNRFHLVLGLGYDFVRNVLDAYFLFAYPFLVDVPGYHVRAVGLPDAERDRNLATLRFISDAAAARGLHFQLGLWMHAYDWVDSPQANYTIAGLTPENNAAYCRDALRQVLDACPNIAGVSFRVHGESGVPEGSYEFWRTVFDGAVQSGKRIEIDLHPKGVNQQLIDVALATGMPVTISPKFTAEHMGLPYQPASIRDREHDGRHAAGDQFVSNLMNMSEGSLRYTRYGYADFLKANRRYGIFVRVWPGTNRLLLWGDPGLAAGLGRISTFCGYQGVEICEPLSFKGRLGSGLPGGRCAYADDSLNPTHDFEKYLYTYRLYGRLLYNPNADASQWRRYLNAKFGNAASAVEQALASASRIMPLVTTTHVPSAHYGWYFPEIYTNMPIVDETLPHPFRRDSDEPIRFGNVSAMDPVLFSKIEEFADEIVSGKRSARYSPLCVAAWLDVLAAEATRCLDAAASQVADDKRPEFRRLVTDVTILSGLGRFFAAKMRAGVAYALFTRARELGRLREAVKEYRLARASWVGVIAATRGVYRDDITFGLMPNVRGNWADRLPVIEADLGAMEQELDRAEAAATRSEQDTADKLAPLATLDEMPPTIECSHIAPTQFTRGQSVTVELCLGQDIAARLFYRHVNQAESYCAVEMTRENGARRATIPAGYTDSPYALEYFIELRDSSGRAWFYPGFAATLDNQPYFVVRQANK
ncbi:MAG: hypothetical protein HY868_25290 [Chloroflexi bacterium]|nr:hypothetical protein [Chloroflexota bacterium]